MIEGNDSLNESLKYVKVYNWARTLILSGVLKTNDKMLSEHMLQKKFGVSRQTVRNALLKLEDVSEMLSVLRNQEVPEKGLRSLVETISYDGSMLIRHNEVVPVDNLKD